MGHWDAVLIALLTICNIAGTLYVAQLQRPPVQHGKSRSAQPGARQHERRQELLTGNSRRSLLQSPEISPGILTTYPLPDNPDLTGGPPTTPEYVALCLVVKNQHLDIREWLLYHKWVGVHKIYLYDHESNPPLLATIRDQVTSGFVEYSHFSGHHQVGKTFMETAQAYAYHDCLARHRQKHRWMGFFDADEFLLVTDPTARSLSDVLQDYEGFGGLAVNWVMFSSSGHVTRPPGLVLRAYTACYPPSHKINKHVKLLVNPRYTLGLFDDPHRAVYSRRDLYTVSEAYERVDGSYTYRALHGRLSLHHYMCKSEEEWKQKMDRGAGDGKKEVRATFAHMRVLARDNCSLGVERGRRFEAEAGHLLSWHDANRALPVSTWPRFRQFPLPAHTPQAAQQQLEQAQQQQQQQQEEGAREPTEASRHA